MPNKDFLENYPLYRECDAEHIFQISPVSAVRGMYGAEYETNIVKPSINGHCQFCNQIQTYNMTNDYEFDENNPAGNISHLIYSCAGCAKVIKHFFVLFFKKKVVVENDDKKGAEEEMKLFMKKVGQQPAWSIEIDTNLKDKLGDMEKSYKNGLICESQGYGIGAYAYYRRIIENIIDELLVSISDLIDSSEREAYEQAISDISMDNNASDKIKLVKDLLPDSLRPDGINPLSVLYSALSGGLHEESDEDCLQMAENIRSAMVFLVEQVVNREKVQINFLVE